jgi:hypothetical protein
VIPAPLRSANSCPEMINSSPQLNATSRLDFKSRQLDLNCAEIRWEFGASEKPRHDGFTELPYPPAAKRLPLPRTAFQIRSIFDASRNTYELTTQAIESAPCGCRINPHRSFRTSSEIHVDGEREVLFFQGFRRLSILAARANASPSIRTDHAFIVCGPPGKAFGFVRRAQQSVGFVEGCASRAASSYPFQRRFKSSE